jgi:hypothetical protein
MSFSCNNGMTIASRRFALLRSLFNTLLTAGSASSGFYIVLLLSIGFVVLRINLFFKSAVTHLMALYGERMNLLFCSCGRPH